MVPEKVGEVEIVDEAEAVGPTVGEVEIVGEAVAVSPAVTSTQIPATDSVPIGHSTQDWQNLGVTIDKQLRKTQTSIMTAGIQHQLCHGQPL